MRSFDVIEILKTPYEIILSDKVKSAILVIIATISSIIQFDFIGSIIITLVAINIARIYYEASSIEELTNKLSNESFSSLLSKRWGIFFALLIYGFIAGFIVSLIIGITFFFDKDWFFNLIYNNKMEFPLIFMLLASLFVFFIFFYPLPCVIGKSIVENADFGITIKNVFDVDRLKGLFTNSNYLLFWIKNIGAMFFLSILLNLPLAYMLSTGNILILLFVNILGSLISLYFAYFYYIFSVNSYLLLDENE